MESFRSGTYQFDVQAKITLSCGETIAHWSSQDALIIKILTGILQEKLKPFLFKTCYHLKGNGGLKGSLYYTEFTNLIFLLLSTLIIIIAVSNCM